MRRYLVDDLRRRDAEDLPLEDVIEPLTLAWEELPHPLAVVEPRDDLGDVEPALHVEISEGVLRVVEAPRVLLLEQVDHLHDDPARSEDLVLLGLYLYVTRRTRIEEVDTT